MALCDTGLTPSPLPLNPFPNKPLFLRACRLSLLKTQWGKGEIDSNKQFLLFPQCFPPV